MTELLTARTTIVAVIDCSDGGPCDPEPTASCPHCGADGRYIYTCLMSDGSHKGMMKGCLQTFAKDACARQCEIAMEKKAHGYTSRWDERVLDAIDALPYTGIDALRSVCRQVAIEKKSWMQKKGFRR